MAKIRSIPAYIHGSCSREILADLKKIREALENFKILKEESEVLAAESLLRVEFEVKLENQARAVYEDLVRLGWTHCIPVQRPPCWKC